MIKIKSPVKEALKFCEKKILTWGRTGHSKVVFGVVLKKAWEPLKSIVKILSCLKVVFEYNIFLGC